jgi:predicted house-cleaning noncanonical NTP pyrophosphatase (MazG superfamily)
MGSYPKIVRDKIPDIITESGKKPLYEFVSIEEAIDGLEVKLHEELAEYMADHSLEELADLLEVVHGILFLKGISWDEIEELRLKKRAERGGFESCVLLKDIQ